MIKIEFSIDEVNSILAALATYQTSIGETFKRIQSESLIQATNPSTVESKDTTKE
jgi:hypothetical protein